MERGGRQAVRLEQWKGVRMNMSRDPNAAIELYRLTDDLGEENNLADQHPEIVKKMEDIMRQAHQYSEIFPFKYEKAENP
jgi:hypothetical protein